MGSGVEGHGSLFCVSVALVNSCLPVCVLCVYVLCVDCVDFVCVGCVCVYIYYLLHQTPFLGGGPTFPVSVPGFHSECCTDTFGQCPHRHPLSTPQGTT